MTDDVADQIRRRRAQAKRLRRAARGTASHYAARNATREAAEARAEFVKRSNSTGAHRLELLELAREYAAIEAAQVVSE